MTRVLVTGGTGFVGRAVVCALQRRGVDAVAAGRADADLLAPDGPADLLSHARPTHIVHLAWCTKPGQYWTTRENLDWVAATLRLAQAAADGSCGRFVIATSAAVYAPLTGPLHEQATPCAPETLYGSCKAAAASLLEAAAAQLGVAVAEARLFQPYGPGEPADRLVPSVIVRLLRGEVAEVTAGTQRRDFIHVDDAGDAIAALTLSPACGPVNVGTGYATSVADVVRAIAEQVDGADRVHLGAIDAPRTERAEMVADVGRLRDEVGWRPARTLEEGLAETVEWWREHDRR